MEPDFFLCELSSDLQFAIHLKDTRYCLRCKLRDPDSEQDLIVEEKESVSIWRKRLKES